MINIKSERQDIFFAGNITVEISNSHTGSFGDIAHGRLMVSFFDEELCRFFGDMQMFLADKLRVLDATGDSLHEGAFSLIFVLFSRGGFFAACPRLGF